MDKIALLVDGNNVIHRYWETPLVAPVLDLSLCYLEQEGEVNVRIFYLDNQRLKVTENIAGSPPYNFRPGTGDGIADFKIKKEVERLNRLNDPLHMDAQTLAETDERDRRDYVDTICIASGDRHLASHHTLAQAEGKKTIAIALEGKMSAEIVEAAERSLILPIDIIESFSKDMGKYIEYRDSVLRGERTIDSQKGETLRLLSSGYKLFSGDSDEG